MRYYWYLNDSLFDLPHERAFDTNSFTHHTMPPLRDALLIFSEWTAFRRTMKARQHLYITDFALDSLDQSIEIVCRWLVRPWHTLHKGRMIALFENLSSLQVESKKCTQKSPYWVSEPSAHLNTNLASTVLQAVSLSNSFATPMGNGHL